MSVGKTRPQSPAHTALSISSIAELLNNADAGITALIELLRSSRGGVSPEGIAALIKPHADALKRASAELNDHT